VPNLLKPARLTLAACVLALAVAGCGGDDGEKPAAGDPAPPAAEPAPKGAAEPGGNTVEVKMESIEYVPAKVTVPVGGTVKWTNTDSPPHTVTKEDGPGAEFDSGNMAPDDTFEQKFDEAGTVNYVCTIHPNQKGVLTVE